jgi:ribosomal protein L37AE/L43A
MKDFGNQSRLKRAGKVRLGYKVQRCPGCKKEHLVKNNKAYTACPNCGASMAEAAIYPTAATHFILDDAPDLIPIYGTKPNRLNIYLPFDTIEENMPSFHKYRTAASVICQGDGEKIVYAINAQTGKPIIRDGFALVYFEETDAGNRRIKHSAGDFMACPGKEHNLYAKCAFCKPSTTLRFLVREVPRMAYFEVNTRSIWNYLNLVGALEYYSAPEPRGLGIGLKYVPFYLDFVPQMISVPNLDKNGNSKKGPDGKPAPKIMVEKYFLTLEIEPAYMARISAAKRQLMDPVRLMLGAPLEAMDGIEDDYEDEDVMVAPASEVVILTPQTDPPKPGSNPIRATLTPAQLKAKLEEKVAASTLRDPNTQEFLPISLYAYGEKTANLVSAKFQEAFEGAPDAEERYHEALRWLTGQESAHDLSAAWADALLHWLLNGNKSKKWGAVVMPPAFEEAAAVYQAAVQARQEEGLASSQLTLDEWFPKNNE